MQILQVLSTDFADHLIAPEFAAEAEARWPGAQLRYHPREHKEPHWCRAVVAAIERQFIAGAFVPGTLRRLQDIGL